MSIRSQASSIVKGSMVALLLGLLVAIPAGVGAQATQQAGKISIVVPTAYLVRASQQLNAAPAMPVNWGDVINTGHLARARISLTDGSVLNVGSDSNLTVAKHDASAQQTDLDLNYGRVRAKAVKLVKPDSHFQIRTSVGVAGVVGTEMIVSFETPEESGGAAAASASSPNHDKRKMGLICLEGACKLCDLFLNCVLMKGGQVSSIRGNEAPSQPAPLTPIENVQAVNATQTTGAAATGAGGIGSVGAVAIGSAVASTVATVVVRTVAKTTTCPPPPPPTGGIIPRKRAACTTITTGGGHINGQRGP
jgi:hypothetical protein